MPDQTPVTDDDLDALDLANMIEKNPHSYSDTYRGAARAIRAHVPAPQIIRTVEELEALDPLTVVYTPNRDSPVFVGDFVADIHYDPDYADDLPAVVVTSGEHVRACREALEGGAT